MLGFNTLSEPFAKKQNAPDTPRTLTIGHWFDEPVMDAIVQWLSVQTGACKG